LNRDYQRGYSKGYNAGSARRWPEHKPPYPQGTQVANLMKAVHELRDSADGICSTIDPEDDFYKQLSPGIEAVDAALREISIWLKQVDECSPPTVNARND